MPFGCECRVGVSRSRSPHHCLRCTHAVPARTVRSATFALASDTTGASQRRNLSKRLVAPTPTSKWMWVCREDSVRDPHGSCTVYRTPPSSFLPCVPGRRQEAPRRTISVHAKGEAMHLCRIPQGSKTGDLPSARSHHPSPNHFTGRVL